MGKTLIVDDEEDMRVLLRATIDRADRGLHVVGEAASGEEAIAVRPTLDLDVIVLDQRMPGLSGLETASAFLEVEPDLAIVLYSAFIDEDVADQARRVGVRRCVTKGDTAGLIRALRELNGFN